MIELGKRVIPRWRKVWADEDTGGDHHIELIFRTGLEPAAAAAALNTCVSRVFERFEAQATPPLELGGAEPFMGEWDVVPFTGGALLLGGRKCDAPEYGEYFIRGVVAELDRDGHEGSLTVYQRPTAPRPPSGPDVIFATAWSAGGKVSLHKPQASEREPFQRIITAAIRWCLTSRPDLALTINLDATPNIILRRSDSPERQVLDSMYQAGIMRMRSIGIDGYRALGIRPTEGRVVLAIGGVRLLRDGWAPAVQSLTSFLTETYADLEYADISRTRNLHNAEYPDNRPDHPRGPTYRESLQHVSDTIPDPQAVHLLNPAHTSKLPAEPEWRRTTLPHGRVLLEHIDPQAWFRPATLAETLHDRHVPPRELVDRARRSLAPLLHNPTLHE